MLAVSAGEGILPVEVIRARHDAVMVRIEGVESHNPGAPEICARFEQLGQLFGDMRGAGVNQVCFAGAMRRPALNPVAFDSRMVELAPSLMAAMRGGDDGLLRFVARVFEEEGFAVVGAHEAVPGLLAAPGLMVGPKPSDADLADAMRATAILEALGPVDVGQAAVVAGGLCLGIETVQGTDFLLRLVAVTDPVLRRGARGVLVKRPKPGQDLRFDLPAIGPETVAGAAAAGLAGIVAAPGAVMVLDRDATYSAARAAGLFLFGR